MTIDLIALFELYAVWIAAMVFAGLAGGLVAGLLGVGGGIVTVPILFLVLGAMGVEDGVGMKMAVATSLATIVFTSISSTRSHYLHGAVDFALLKAWGVPVFAGVVVGTSFGSVMDGWVLSLVFAVVALGVAIRMLTQADTVALGKGFPSRSARIASGATVGAISALMGIGGGTLSVPILTHYGFDIRRAVGTAAAIGFVIAIPGAIGYMIAGLTQTGLPIGSIGYVNLIALASLVPLTSATAPLGAKLAHVIPRHLLRYSFAAFLILTSLRMFYGLLTS